MQFAQLRGQLVSALVERRRIERLRALALEREAHYMELADVVRGEIDAGRPAVFRLAEIEVARSEVARTLAQLEGDEARNEAVLDSLVGPVTGHPALPLEPLSWSGDVDALHAVRVAGRAISVADAGVDGARAGFRPDWGVSLTYKQRESGESFAGDDWVSLMLSFSVPLWQGRSQQPALRAARADRAAAGDRYQAAAKHARAEWAALDARHRAAVRSLDVMTRQQTAVESRIATTLLDYEAGRGDYSTVIDGALALNSLAITIADETARRDSAIAMKNSLLVQP